jgi:hypothetical protein
MPWSEFPLTTLVLPQDWQPGQPRIVLNGDTGQIQIFNGANVLIALIDATGMWVLDADGSYVRIYDEDPGDGAVVDLRPPDSAGTNITPGRLRAGAPPFGLPALTLQGPDIDGSGAAIIALESDPVGGSNQMSGESDAITWTANDGQLSLVAEIADMLLVAGNLAAADIQLRAGSLFPVYLRHNAALEITGAIDWNGATTEQANAVAFVSTSSNTYTNLAGDPGTAFTAPPSGKVSVHVSAALDAGAAGTSSDASFQIRAGSTVGAGAIVYPVVDDDRISLDGTTAIEVGRTTIVTGLASGTVYNVQMLYKRTGASTGGFARRKVSVTPVL